MLRKYIIPVMLGLFNLSLLAFPREALGAAREGLLLWFNTVLPSLLPFAVGINLLSGLHILRRLPPFWTAVFTGLAAGYPLGAKTVGDMCRAGEITPAQGRRLLTFCNNAGPLFIIGAVGTGMFGSTRSGYILWAGHVLGALAIALGNRLRNRDTISLRENVKHPTPSLGKTLGDSVKNAMEAMALVGGLIIFFSVVTRIGLTLLGLDEAGYSAGALAGIAEISGGTRIIAAHVAQGEIPLPALIITAAIIGFGGLSVHAQALYFTSDTKIKVSVYLYYKLLHAALAAGFTAGIVLLLPAKLG